ncbi:hydroxyphenylacetyl-CoA thioesterase PaaI [Micromonospora sp. WMMD998]|uniref:hydroxyphenylacetyl-CoA thioesterase PaaI n=1 Tax=Micromonospora sp. WMMD998 TaxID=3016092 RepID=UPI00249B0577|nr:hydroxyphenylacetyl-CoA thioesterase PaaI [Micromonospora sp. WMMD998]WFE40624.1 hydroxyphenylacetyl-CoA thioesterase PaaI [Micromonospora sp. WMMD998]
MAADDGRTAAHDMFDADVASKGLGIELVSAGGGAAVARMRVTPAMLNGHAIGHGGFVFLLADTAFALACNSHGPVTVAAGGEISFLRPVRGGDVLEAYATERVRHGRSGIYDVTVRRGDEVVAEFRGRSRVVKEGPPLNASGRGGAPA